MCVCRSHQLHSQQTQCPLSWTQHNLTSLIPEGQKPHSTPPKSTCTQRTFTHLLQALTALSSHTWGLPHVALQYHSCAYLQLPTAPLSWHGLLPDHCLARWLGLSHRRLPSWACPTQELWGQAPGWGGPALHPKSQSSSSLTPPCVNVLLDFHCSRWK